MEGCQTLQMSKTTIATQKQCSMKLLEQKGLVGLKVVPPVKNGEEEKLKFNKQQPKEGLLLTKGVHKLIVTIDKSSKEEEPNKITVIGLTLPDKKPNDKMSLVFESVKVTVVKSTGTKKSVINLPKSATIRDISNVLKSSMRGVEKVVVEVSLKANTKVRLNLRGCVTKPTPPSLSTTSTPGITTTISEINEQSFKCQTIYNLISNTKNVLVTTNPMINSAQINSLRFDKSQPTKGTILKKGAYSIQISLPTGKTVTLVQLGIILPNENRQSNAATTIKDVKITATRTRMSFGNLLYIPQTIKTATNMRVRDLRNLLTLQVLSVSKVTLEFVLLRSVKTSIKMEGCQIIENNTTTVSPASNTPNYGVVNNQNYMCQSSVSLLPFNNLFSISLIPNITDNDLANMRASTTKDVSLRQATYTLTLQLPPTQSVTLTQFGFEFLSRRPTLPANPIVTLINLEFTRIRISFGNIVSTPVKLVVSNTLKVQDLRNLLTQQYTQINSIVARFAINKDTKVRFIVNGCYSPTHQTLTTQSPVGCIHLNKHYNPNELIYVGQKCDYKICSDGIIMPVFNCEKRWTPWKACSKLCGAGQTTRRQICVFNPRLKSVDKKDLMGKIDETCFEKLEVKPCFEKPCAASCKYTAWSSWSACDNSTCKDENQVRLREEISNPNHVRCTEPLMESRRCLKPNCSCVENAEMSDCANVICPTDCDHMNDKVKCIVAAKSGCVKACICKHGYLYQNGKCVPRSNCECLKPIFKGWILPTTLSHGGVDSTNVGGGVTRPGSSKTDIDGVSQTGGTGSTTKRTKKNTVFKLDPLNRNEYSKLISNRDKTPPWLPGTTPRSLYLASPPWFPGTTDAGATVKIATEPPKKVPIPTPPSGLTASPPDGLRGQTEKLKFIVTAAFAPGYSKPATAKQNEGPQQPLPGQPNNGRVSKPRSTPFGSTSSPLSINSSAKVPSLSSSSPNSQSRNGSVSVPGSSATTKVPSTGNNYVKANSPLTVDCQTCLCTNGQLVCSGPKCKTGNNTWSAWTAWSPCTAICGSGLRRRFRQCMGYGCKDSTTPAPGIKRFTPTVGIEAEDKSCMRSECSCVYTRQWINILLGKDEIKRYNIDTGLAWMEKDNKKGFTSPEELVKQDDIVRSEETVYMKCSKCKCKNGQFSCMVDCK